MEIFRIFKCQAGVLQELAFLRTKEAAQFYLLSCNKHNTDPDTFYFSQAIILEE